MLEHRPRALFVFLTAFLVSAPLAASAQVECGDTIGPNQIVILEENIGPCNSNVPDTCGVILEGPNAFLFGNGHVLRCDDGDPPDVGICLRGSGATLENIRVRGCLVGVKAGQGGDHRIEDVTAKFNPLVGIELDSNDNLVRYSTANRNGVGIVANGRRNEIRNTTANRNDGYGIWLAGNAQPCLPPQSFLRDSDVVNVTARRNGEDGLRISTTGVDNDIRNSDFSNNDDDGAQIRGDRNRLTNSNINGNDNRGVKLSSPSEENLVVDNTIQGNTNEAIKDSGTGNVTAPNDL